MVVTNFLFATCHLSGAERTVRTPKTCWALWPIRLGLI